MMNVMFKVRLILVISLLTLVVVNVQSQAAEKLMEVRISDRPISIDGIVLFSQIELPKFYISRNYNLAWDNEKNRNDLLISLKESFNEGLNPKDYHLDRINNILSNSKYKKLSSEQLVKLDLLLTDAMLLYASHLVSGKVEQSELTSEWEIDKNKRPEKIDSLIAITLKNRKLKGAFQSLKPQHYFYLLLKQKLKDYREIEENGGWKKIPEGETLKKDMEDERISAIRKYLIITKDLPVSNNVDNTLFDEELEKAVKKFQLRHNLTADGVIGKGTLEQMNIPVEGRIDQIRINLERARWVLHNPENDFLMVNIAGFNVKRIKNKQEVFTSRVIVGKYHKSTPIFKDTMEYIVLNPTWTLPYSIATSETLPKLKKNPNYLAEKHMIIMDRSGKILDPGKINFHKYSSGNFPFIVRQTAGPWNALGQVKFIFPNKHAIYLHDTPARSLFNMQDRAFSHGCIRTENKWELLMNLMDDPKVWNMDKINEILKSGETTRINLPKPIPIYLLYWTTGVDRENNIYFLKDIYKRDKNVLKALDTPVRFKKS